VAAFPIIISAAPYSITTGSALTYEQFLSTLNYIVYRIEEIYLESDSISQLSTPFYWNTTHPDGAAYTDSTNANIDPYQSTAVLVLKTPRDSAVINSNSHLTFNLQANAYLEIVVWAETFNLTDLLDRELMERVIARQDAEEKKQAEKPGRMPVEAILFLAAAGFITFNLLKKNA
jgi:hypothetical protein